MIDSKIGLKCTGCTACKSICPTNAIIMKANSEGFQVPVVNNELCVQCGLCIKTCPIVGEIIDYTYNEPKVYAAKNKNLMARIDSTSGGLFTVFAETIIEKGGYVIGAYYDENFVIRHKIINEIGQIKELRQSKYAQSDLGEIFKATKKLLDNNNLVLFCGTPCQSAGLQSYLKKIHDNLYCCDFICRGVISPKVYKKFLQDMSLIHGAQLKSVQFKNKDFGWNEFSTKLTFQNNQVYQKKRNEDYYMIGYLKHNLYLRPCCHECNYKKIPRVSDVSLGDFWGIGNYNKSLDDNKGTSVVLVNSDKGKILIEWVQKKIEIEERSLEEVMQGNGCLLQSAPEGEYRNYFFAKFTKVRFDLLIERINEKSLHLNWKERLARYLYTFKQKWLRKDCENSNTVN